MMYHSIIFKLSENDVYDYKVIENIQNHTKFLKSGREKVHLSQHMRIENKICSVKLLV